MRKTGASWFAGATVAAAGWVVVTAGHVTGMLPAVLAGETATLTAVGWTVRVSGRRLGRDMSRRRREHEPAGSQVKDANWAAVAVAEEEVYGTPQRHGSYPHLARAEITASDGRTWLFGAGPPESWEASRAAALAAQMQAAQEEIDRENMPADAFPGDGGWQEFCPDHPLLPIVTRRLAAAHCPCCGQCAQGLSAGRLRCHPCGRDWEWQRWQQAALRLTWHSLPVPGGMQPWLAAAALGTVSLASPAPREVVLPCGRCPSLLMMVSNGVLTCPACGHARPGFSFPLSPYDRRLPR